jgi:hypothetical protein
MHRTDASGNASNLFTDGNAGSGVPATVVDDDWLNAVQEEICNAVEADGTTLVKGTNTQLRSALAAILTAVIPGGRLTTVSGTPVPTTDQINVGTLYYTPYVHNKIALYNGTRWVLYTFSELSQVSTDATKSPAAAGASSVYDLFVWNDSGTLRLSRGPAWSSDTARGTGAGTTELQQQDGRWLNKVAITNGPAALRGLYVGTVRTSSTSLFHDQLQRRWLWNNFNRVDRPMKAVETTDTWTYSTATIRQVNGFGSNQLDFVRGFDEDSVIAETRAAVINSTSTNRGVRTGIGVDSTTVISSTIGTPIDCTSVGYSHGSAVYQGMPGIGRHFLAWLECGAGVDTQTWMGDFGDASIQMGIVGRVRA